MIITLVIETILKSSVILVLTVFATLALRRRSAALRHSVWTVGLLCSLAVPLFSPIMPVWHVRSAEALTHSANAVAPQSRAAEPEPVVVRTPASVPSTPPWLTPERALLLVCLVWMLGVLSVASLLLRETVRLARIAFRACTVEETSWRELVWEVSQALALKRSVRLMRNSNASVLGTWGTLRPRIILPRESEGWSDKRMRVVLGHELAHVKRNDWLIQIIAEAARAVYWFNPLFWIACTYLRRESEHACDDAAMNLGGPFAMDGPTYAGHVLDLARALKHSGQPASAALAMASTSNLERRLIAVLNPSLNRRVTGKATAAIILVLALALTLPLAAVSSQAPIPQVPLIPAVEFTPSRPVESIATTSTAPTVVQRRISQPAIVAGTASPAVLAETVQPAALQNQGGSLSGTVLDQSGAVIPGAKVSMTARSSGTIRRTLSNEAGVFAFNQLPPDNYSATVDVPDFAQGKFSYLVTDSNSIARFNVVLPLRLTTVITIAVPAPLGPRCFSMFGAVKADGTPFTAADCPGGTVFIAPPKPPITTAPEPATTEVISVNPPPATVPAAGQRPIRVGGDVQAGNLLYHPSPAYPAEARSKGIQGVVILSGLVAEDGQLISLKVISSSDPLLETSVIDTIQNWRYKPTLLNGAPVQVPTTITLNFTMD